MENNIPLTVYRVEKENVTMTPTETGLSFNLTLHMSAEYKTHYYEEVRTISADAPTRIFQMFEKAKNFTDSYENDVQIANTLALYARGIGNAYLACNGTLINQGHLTYDPVDTFIRGNRETLQELAENPGDAIDLGAVPAATWVDETRFLTEPSYVPTGADIGDGIPVDLVKNTLINGFDVKDKMDNQCETLDNQTQVEECLDNNDPDELMQRYNDLSDEAAKVERVMDAINKWKKIANTDTDCDTFKDKTKGIIEKIAQLIQDIQGAGKTQGEGVAKAQTDEGNYNSMYKPDLDSLSEQLGTIQDNLFDLQGDQMAHIESIDNNWCSDVIHDCYPCEYELDDGGCDDCKSCTGCKAERCKIIEEDEGNAYYTCGNENQKPREVDAECTQKVNCEKDENGKETCDTEECNRGTCLISQCSCLCHPNNKLLTPVKDDINYIYDRLDQYVKNLDDISNKTYKRKSDMQDSVDMVDSINQTKFMQEGYDVNSQINYRYVRFNDDTSTKSWCYPSYAIKDAGICGNKVLSMSGYTAQVLTATYLTLTGTCPPCSKALIDTFLAMYLSEEVNYTISEKIIDDKNRIMLHNIFAEEQDLYGYNTTSKLFHHVAAEFVIYENKNISTKSWAIIPIYFPLMEDTCKTLCKDSCKAWGRVSDALFSESCNTYKGVNSTTGEC
jgi:archaellum component FlaC